METNRRLSRVLFLVVVVCMVAIITVSGCAQSSPPPTAPTASASTPAAPTVAPPTESSAPTEQPPEPTNSPVPSTEAPADTPAAEPVAVMSPDPQSVEFEAEDGQVLSGTYYPAAEDAAPCVVLLHWAPGDQTVWALIAPWLQNRVDLAGIAAPSDAPWHDSSWFPAVPEGESYAVLTFTFRGCEGGCQEFAREGWLLDAQAAVDFAKTLPGVDPRRIATVGASIGADGAVNGCAEGCLGVFSLSPGSYLTRDYAAEVTRLASMSPAVPAKCIAAEGDQASAAACESASGDTYEMVIYPGDDHGVELIRPDADPEVLQSILDLLARVF